MSNQDHTQAGERQPFTWRFWIGPAALVAVVVLVLLLLQRNVQGRSGSAGPATPAASALPAAGQAQPAVAASGPLTSADQVQRIAPAEAKALVDQGEAVLYDARPLESYQTKHAAGAISLPEDQIQSQFSSLPKDKILILYCT